MAIRKPKVSAAVRRALKDGGPGAEAGGDEAGAAGGIRSVTILKPKIATVMIPLVSTSRVVSHRWSEKAKQQLRDQGKKTAKEKKGARDPVREFMGSLYSSEGSIVTPQVVLANEEPPKGKAVIRDGWFGAPATAFKKAAVAACRYVDGVTMTMARGVLFIQPDGFDSNGVDLVRIEGDGPYIREDCVKINNGKSTDIRYRGEWRKWSTVLRVKYNENILSDEQVFNLFAIAGLHVGVMEGRPGAPFTTMDWGLFELDAGQNEQVQAAE